MPMDKGKRRESVTPTKAKRTHGKDAKLAALVREVDNGSSSKDMEGIFDVKKIGKKAIFRPILSSPFNARWPTLTPVLQDVLLHTLLHLLQTEDAQKHFKRDNQSIPRTSSRKTKEKNKRRRARLVLDILRQQGILSSLETEIRPLSSEVVDEKSESQVKPFLCGLNSVTRQMECLIRHELNNETFKEENEGSSSSSSIKHSPTIIFVCQADVDPPTLVSHFPLLSATYSAVLKQDCYLIRLPADAESKLSKATSLRRCSVLSVDANLLDEESEAGKSLKDLLTKMKDSAIQSMRLDWLDSAIASMRGQEAPAINLMEPRIKHMRSSSILDMNTVKANKKAARKKRKIQAKVKSHSDSQLKGVKRKLWK